MDEPPLLAHAASRDVNRMVIRPARMRIGGTPLVAITINAIARCNRPETGAPGDVGCGLSPCRTPGTTPRTAPDRTSVLSGTSVSVRVDLGGRRISKKTIKRHKKSTEQNSE